MCAVSSTPTDPAQGKRGPRRGPGWSDERIAEAYEAGVATIERLRQRFVAEGLQAALRPDRTGTRLHQRKLDGAQEAHLIALACSAPPNGRARWTLSLLARRMIELAYVDTLSYETVRQTLEKERPPATPQADDLPSRLDRLNQHIAPSPTFTASPAS